MNTHHPFSRYLFPGIIILFLLLIAPIAADVGTVMIRTVPDGGTVFVDGTSIGTAPVTVDNLAYGEHEFEVHKDGYEPSFGLFMVNAPMADVGIPLLPAMGVLSIRSIPDDATIAIDGKMLSEKTPLTYSVNPGVHTIQIAKSGYEMEQMTFSIGPGEEISVDSVLKGPAGAAITNTDGTIQVGISSEPTGATVTLNRLQQTRKTPGIYDVTPGDNQVRILLDGYDEYNEEIAFPKESPLIVRLNQQEHKSIEPILPSATLAVLVPVILTSEPSGATVLVNGLDSGNTPFSTSLKTGPQTISVELEGYESYSEEVDLTNDEPYERHVTLQVVESGISADTGYRLTIITRPPGATVSINGRYAGHTPFTARFAARSYDVSVSMPRFQTVERILDFSDRKDKEFIFALKKVVLF